VVGGGAGGGLEPWRGRCELQHTRVHTHKSFAYSRRGTGRQQASVERRMGVWRHCDHHVKTRLAVHVRSEGVQTRRRGSPATRHLHHGISRNLVPERTQERVDEVLTHRDAGGNAINSGTKSTLGQQPNSVVQALWHWRRHGRCCRCRARRRRPGGRKVGHTEHHLEGGAHAKAGPCTLQ